MLHEEIDRLPERFRMSVILCDLEGNTHEQAARHLGWPVGTVKSRLTRARERLRDRLTRRGLSPSAGEITLLRPGVMEDLLPGALVHATASAAVRFGASRTLLGGSAAILAQGVLTAMAMTRWWKVASLLLVAGATVSGAGLLSGKGAVAVAARSQDEGKRKTAGADMPVAAVKLGKARLAVVEHGTLEPASRNEVLVETEGRLAIKSILPEGTRVKKGDLVAELDSAALRAQLVNQKITTQSAEVAYNNARLSREVAEIAVVEYEQGIYPQDVQAIQGEIKIAELGVQKTEARFERTRRARQKLNEVFSRKDRLTESSDILAELELDDRMDAIVQALSRERFALEQAQSKLARLNNYTKAKTIKELKSEVEKAHLDELAKQARWELGKEKVVKLEKQIALCRIYAPADGMVFSSTNQGVVARERMKIMEIFSTTPMLASVNVPESMIAHVKPGAKARVLVDAFPDETYTGVIQQVAPVPERPRLGKDTGKNVYPTLVKLDQSPKGLRPGMNARVEIPTEGGDAIIVPISAVLRAGRMLRDDGKDYVAVQRSGGGFEWREVVLGETNGKDVEVKQGLKPFEQVALHPLELIREGLNHYKNLEATTPR